MNLEDHADHVQALTVACPPRDERGCGIPAGTACINLTNGAPLQYLPAHDARLQRAGVLHAPLDSRELARDDHHWSSR